MISFSVPGEPVSKERPRTVNGHTYTPQKTLDHEEKIQKIWDLSVRKWNPHGRFEVTIEFCVERDNKDLDNMVKTVLDALQGRAWKNDLHIDSITAYKMKRKPGQTIVEIERVEEYDDA